MAKQAGILYLTFFLIAATSLLFFAFDCPYLVEKVSVLIPVVSGLTFVFTLSNLFKTSFSDPGTVYSVFTCGNFAAGPLDEFASC